MGFSGSDVQKRTKENNEAGSLGAVVGCVGSAAKAQVTAGGTHGSCPMSPPFRAGRAGVPRVRRAGRGWWWGQAGADPGQQRAVRVASFYKDVFVYLSCHDSGTSSAP